MNEMQIIKILEQYSRKIDQEEGQVKVQRVPDYKTIYIEQNGAAGRSIVLREFKVDGKIFWAGYSPYSETIFVSQAG